MNLFTDPIPPGYDRVTMTTQVHQAGIPAMYLSPEVAGGKPIITWAGPDGVQRPLLVELAFLICGRCGATIIQGVVGGGTKAHDAWHNGEFAG